MQSVRSFFTRITMSFILVVSLAPSFGMPVAFAEEVTAYNGSDSGIVAQGVTATPGWNQCGECEWRVSDSVLTVRPIQGGSGLLDDWGSGVSPWGQYAWDKGYVDPIISAVIEPGVKAQSCSGMFNVHSFMTSIDLSGLDTSAVTNMNSMFGNCSELTSLDLSTLDTSKVTSMNAMFYGCFDLTSINLSSFDTSKVTDMSRMFSGCTELQKPDLSRFNTSKVTSMQQMFNDCVALTSLDMSGFDTSNVTNMKYMFLNAGMITEFKVGNGYKACDIAGIPTSISSDKWWSTTSGTWMTREEIFNHPNTASAYFITKPIPIYRLYNEALNSEHFFTSSADEARILSQNWGWTYEGVGWYAPESGTPVYRLYNPALGHLYTSSQTEIVFLTTFHGWRMDNDGKPMLYSGGDTPIYRLYNEALHGQHLLTTSKEEYNALPAYQWQQEGQAISCVALGGDYPLPVA